MAPFQEILEASTYILSSAKAWKKYQRPSQKLVHLENAISMQRRAVELVSDDNPDMPNMLTQLRILLHSRYGRLAELSDIKSAISVYEKVIQLTAKDHPDRTARLFRLNLVLFARSQTPEGLEDVEYKIPQTRCAIELSPDTHPMMPVMLHSLGMDLYIRFQTLGELKDLESAISTQRCAIKLTPETDHLNMSGRLHNLGTYLSKRFKRLGEVEDIESAISAQSRAVGLTPETDSYLPIRLQKLGLYLYDRFKRLAEPKDIESAISAQRRVVELTPDMPYRLHILGLYLRDRFTRLGELKDIEDAISTLRRAVPLAPEEHSDTPELLSLFGSCLEDRFQRLGELNDLDSSISIQRRAVELVPEGHPDMPKFLNNLCACLKGRYARFEELDDLNSAILVHRRAAKLVPDDYLHMLDFLTNFASSLLSRFLRLGELEDLEAAIQMQYSAIDHMPKDYPNEAGLFHNLAVFLLSRFERLGGVESIESAMLLQRRAIEITPEGHANMLTFLYGLGALLLVRFKQLGDLNDLNSVISTHRSALELAPEGHPIIPRMLGIIGKALAERFARFGEPHDFDAAVEAYKNAFMQHTGSPSGRLEVALSWAVLETEYPHFGSSASQLQAYSHIVDTLPEVIWLGHNITRRYRESAKFSWIVGGAVSVAVAFGNLQQAVEWLEAGRSLILSQILSLRTPLDGLAQRHPELAQQLQELSARIHSAHPMQLPDGTYTVDSFMDNEIHEHRRTVVDYERCLKKIRQFPGFERFMRPQKFTNLASLTEHLDGTFVYINVAPLRRDAVAISRGGTVRLIPLPDLVQGLAEQLRDKYQTYLHSSKPGQRGLVLRPEAQADELIAILDLLWSCIVHPILKALNLMDRIHGQQLPHITWCPTGPLAQLPIHAAGFHQASGRSGLYVYDFVVSSYAPSLSALVRAQTNWSRESLPSSVLIVTQPATPNQSPLPGTIAEGAHLQDILLESHIKSEAFNGNQATLETVQSAIKRLPWVHFACHGVQDTSDPTQSAFALHDGKLTLSTLMKTVADGAELAFLSACQTATGDEKASEESAHLTAGMLAVGFKGVVGTMWSIGDEDAPVVVEAYYKKLLELRRTDAVAERNTGAAYALHEAVKVLRERVGRKSFLRWVPFVHYGV